MRQYVFLVVLVTLVHVSHVVWLCIARCVNLTSNSIKENCSEDGNCSDDLKIVNCANRKLIRVPSDLPQAAEYVDLSDNTISILVVGDFSGCINLLQINLTSNQLSVIGEKFNFSGAPRLQSLSLRKNKLIYSSLPSTLFRGIPNLRQLNISQNLWKISTGYPAGLFEELVNLTDLEVDAILDVPLPTEMSRMHKLKKLYYHGGLRTITNETFAVLANSSVENLFIRAQTYLVTVEPSSFAHFKHLRLLNIAYNRYLGIENASRSWYGLQFTKITELHLTSVTPDEVKSVSVGETFFQYLSLTSIEKLWLDRNDIGKIHDGFAENLPSLTHLRLSENQLRDVGPLMKDISKLQNLTFLYLSYQLWPAPRFHVTAPQYDTFIGLLEGMLPRKHHPVYEDCHAREFENCTLYDCNANNLISHHERLPIAPICIPIPPKLEKVWLAEALGVEDHTLPQVVIFGGFHLRFIDLSSNGLRQIEGPIVFTEPVTNLSVDLSDNQLSCLAPGLFHWSSDNGSTVLKLNLSGNRLAEHLQRDIDGIIFRGSKTLQFLDLTSNGIKSLPRKIFANSQQLVELNLSKNSLKLVEFDLIDLRNLKILDLSFNLFSSMNESTLESFSRMFNADNGSDLKLNLNGNPLQCSCETYKFTQWLYTNRDRFNDFESYTCWFNDVYVNFTQISDILETLDYDCSKIVAVIVAGSLISLALILVSTSVVCYRNRWEIRYACLKFTQKGRLYQHLVEETYQYDYDAFVVYDSSDRSWVTDELLPHLERGRTAASTLDESLDGCTSYPQRGFQLCVHERDFQPGEHIVSNIWNKMERSRKVLLVISKNFTKSLYCDYEMNLARMYGLERGGNVIVPILIELPDVDNVLECLFWILRKVTYIEWPQDEEDREVF